MHFVFLFFYFIQFIFSLIKEIFSIIHLWNLHFSNCKQNIGAGINTLMSISDELPPSIFRRKMEKARLMKEEMDGKVVYFPPDSAFWLWYCNL